MIDPELTDEQSRGSCELATDDKLFFRALRIATEQLVRGIDGAGCLRLVESLHRLADTTVRARRESDGAVARLACRKGCDHCCHMRVVATVPEVAAIAAHLLAHVPPDQLEALPRRIAAVAASGPSMSDEEWGVRGVPCPFLVDRLCMIYEVRPLECRGYNSTSLAACEAARVHYLDWEVPMHMPSFTPYKYVQAAILQAAAGAGLKPQLVELSAGVSLLLADPAALSRWADGEPAFAAAELPPWDPERRAFLPWTPSDELRGIEPSC